MADLTGILDTYSPAKVIDADYEARYEPRSWLGLSQIGHKCGRYLWYVHKNYTRQEPDGRTLRLFQLGNILEDQIVIDLKSAGFTVRDIQKEVTFSDNGVELRGHIDGIIEGLYESKKPHLLEIKTASEKRFNELKKLRSYEKWSETYKAQIHVYMIGLKLKRCLVVVYNKNTSELYTERIQLDREYAINKLSDVFRQVQSNTEPERKCPNASWFESKWCDYREECFKP